jgi:hypothetical protein
MTQYTQVMPTHALAWIPEWLLPPGSHGWWALQPLDQLDLHEPQEDDLFTIDLPRDVPAGQLTEQVGSLLNHPVMLVHGGMRRMRECRLVALPHHEPMYWVTPVVVTGWQS